MSEQFCQHTSFKPGMPCCPDCRAPAEQLNEACGAACPAITIEQDLTEAKDNARVVGYDASTHLYLSSKGAVYAAVELGILKKPVELPTEGAVDPNTIGTPAAPPAEQPDAQLTPWLGEVAVALRPPDEMAVLNVYNGHDDTLSVRGGHAHQPLQPTTLREHPCEEWNKEGVAQHFQHAQHRAIWDSMHNFSNRNRKIGGWLKRLYDALDGALTLVIVDFASDQELPWEMLWLPQFELDPRFKEHGRVFLGSVIPTVRWQSYEDINGDPIILATQAEDCLGTVISYVAPQDAALASADDDILHVACTACYTSIESWKRHLAQEQLWRGMLYIECHTFPHTSRLMAAIGSRDRLEERLSYEQLSALIRPYQYQKTSLFVFLNPLNADEMTFEGVYAQHPGRRSFIELFLSNGARGVISSITGISYAVAPAFARLLLARLYEQQEKSLRIAIVLRDLRRAVAARLPSEPDAQPGDDLLREFISIFMYVYYGSPMASLRLLSAQQEVER